MRGTDTRRSARLIDMPEEQRKEMRKVIRVALVLRKERGESDADILRKSIDVHIQAAREEGCDEGDVEVIAAMARRETIKALAEWDAAEERVRRREGPRP